MSSDKGVMKSHLVDHYSKSGKFYATICGRVYSTKFAGPRRGSKKCKACKRLSKKNWIVHR